MRNFLVFCLLTLSLSLGAQERGSLWTELSSDLTDVSITNAAVSPAVLYFPLNDVGVRASGYFEEFNEESRSLLDLSARYYACSSGYLQAGLVTDFNDSNGFSISGGYTASLGKFYVEPSVRYSYLDEFNRVGLRLAVGLMLN